jgi:hypothetical protein
MPSLSTPLVVCCFIDRYIVEVRNSSIQVNRALSDFPTLDGPTPLYSVERRFFWSFPNEPTSPPVIRGISSPPAAAPAAGGWGISGSGRIHSVGLVRALASGFSEVEVLPAGGLMSADFPSGGGVPQSSGAGSSTSQHSLLLECLFLGPAGPLGSVAGGR